MATLIKKSNDLRVKEKVKVLRETEYGKTE
jgi:hypothetical protein